MSVANGYLKIKTKIDNSEVNKQIKYVENQIDDLKSKLNMADEGFEVGDTSKIESDIEKLGSKLNKLYEKRTIGLNSDQISAEITSLEAKAQRLKEILKQADLGFEVGDIFPVERELENINRQLVIFKAKKEEIDNKNFSKIKSGVKDVNNGIKDTIKNIARWTLALIGVEAAISLVRSAMSDLSSYDKQIGADLEYMRFAIAQALKPLVESLLSIIYKILTYVNMISMAWFGVNLFASATADNFKKMKESTSSAKKDAKELKKTLAGFDEMNIISDTSAKDKNSGGGYTVPSYDLGKIEDVPVPSWLQWILDNGDIVTAILAGLAAGLLAVKLGADALLALGIGIIVAGVVMLIQDIIKFIKDPSWKNFAEILKDIAIILTGVALVLAVLGATTAAVVVAIIAVVVTLVAAIIQNWDKIKEVLGKVGSWIYDHIIKPVGDLFKKLWDIIKETFGNVKEWFKEKFQSAVDAIKSVFGNIGTFFSGVFDKIKSIFQNIGQKVGQVVSTAFKTAVNAVLSIADGIINTPIKAINKLIGVINKVPGINLGTLNTINIPRLRSGGIVNNPGKGVPVGGAIAGESGREGVIPLTDPTAMRLLGQEIGKWITVQNTSNTYLDSRLIKRQMDNREEQFAFATNGR